MANLIIQENGVVRTRSAVHGEEITIQTPCDCSAVSGVQIAGVAYPFYDAAGKPLPVGTGLFAENSLIRVLIDTVNGRATIINHAITPASIGAAPTSHGNHVPATQTANNAKFLRNDNTWQTVTPANIGAPTVAEMNAAIAAIPTPDVSGQINTHNSSSTAHSDIRQLIANKKGAVTYTATIGTSWTENEDTGVKSQNVAISGVTADHTAKVDHRYNGNGTSDGYATFVEEENQYLEFITNGYAETYNGGITFYIFGDAPTISIPIVVEVA